MSEQCTICQRQYVMLQVNLSFYIFLLTGSDQVYDLTVNHEK